LLPILRDAGWPIWPLLATSVLCLALIFERLLSLRRSHVVPAGLVSQVMEMLRNRQDTPEAIARLERNSPLGRVLAEVLRQRHLPREELRGAVEDVGRSVSHELNRYISAIGTIAVVAPLLGLFGTVVGMIDIFGSYSPVGGDPAQLAHGISVALYNTGFGILIAIPAMIFHRYLRGRVDGYLHQMEQAASRTVRVLTAAGRRRPDTEEDTLFTPRAPMATDPLS
jgi:biopolymer transport protein ExbB